jgi:hypothetical protein
MSSTVKMNEKEREKERTEGQLCMWLFIIIASSILAHICHKMSKLLVGPTQKRVVRRD